MYEIRDELKQHTLVMFESLHDDIRLVAEGIVSLDAKVEALRPPDHR